MAVTRLRPDEVEGDIKKQMRMLSNPVLKRFHSMVIAPAMVSIVKLRFLKGKGPNDIIWKSWSAVTKFSGRWSKRYNVRPSKNMVTADKIRNVDTKQLANSYKSTSSSYGVVSGPKGKRNVLIAENEERHGNFITGWDDHSIRIINAEIKEFVNRMALGRFPQAKPKSRI